MLLSVSLILTPFFVGPVNLEVESLEKASVLSGNLSWSAPGHTSI